MDRKTEGWTEEKQTEGQKNRRKDRKTDGTTEKLTNGKANE